VNVVILNHTPNPERAVAVAARLCYAAIGAAELMVGMDDQAVRKVLRTIMTSGHFSALEHASYTFAVDGISRACSHQLVRHRLASYNQQSQRYVTYLDELEFVIPPAIEANKELLTLYNSSVNASFKAYKELIDRGVPAEDARFLLPNAAETKIVITMNIRELLYFFSLRSCRRAQWEIRALSDRMLELALPTAPYIFQDAGASCRRGSCPEGKMTCGNPYTRVIRE
jgi:thymidylate synthase (FAD)